MNLNLTLTIEAPVEMVFEHIVNPDFRMAWLRDMIDIRYQNPSSSRAPGASFVQIQKKGGKSMTLQGTNLAIDLPYMFRYRLADDAFESESMFRLKQVGDLTELELTSRLQGRHPVASLIARTTSRLRRRAVRQELAVLKQLCEGR